MNIHTVKQKVTPATTPKFSIMIPSWNNLPYLRLCIESLRKNSHYTHEIIVHINEGVDGSLTWIQSQTDISYSHSQENIGVCYALNSCRTLASTDYLVYLNDDMYVCPDWDLALAEEIDQLTNPYFFFSATAIETHKQSSCSIEKSYGTHPDNFQEEKLLAEYRQLLMEDWQGATWPPNVVHKDVWDLIGGYSIEYSPGMYSDPDFSYKLWKLGVRLFKGIAKSRVYHFGSVSVKRIKKNDGYYMFIAKWGMTSGTFSKYFLRRGERFDGPLQEQSIPILTRIKNHLKAQLSVLHK